MQPCESGFTEISLQSTLDKCLWFDQCFENEVWSIETVQKLTVCMCICMCYVCIYVCMSTFIFQQYNQHMKKNCTFKQNLSDICCNDVVQTIPHYPYHKCCGSVICSIVNHLTAILVFTNCNKDILYMCEKKTIF